jgi:hypothetical protein
MYRLSSITIRWAKCALMLGFVILLGFPMHRSTVQAQNRSIAVSMTSVRENTWDGTGLSDGRSRGKTINYRLDTVGYRNRRIVVLVGVYTIQGGLVTCNVQPFCQPNKTLASWSYVIPRRDANTTFSSVFIPYTAFPRTAQRLYLAVSAYSTDNGIPVRGNVIYFDWQPR